MQKELLLLLLPMHLLSPKIVFILGNQENTAVKIYIFLLENQEEWSKFPEIIDWQ